MMNRQEPRAPTQDNTKTYLYAFRYGYDSVQSPRTISTKDLNKMAHTINNALYKANTDTRVQKDERNYDTVAVGVNDKNDTLFVAANIKVRNANPESKTGIEYGRFGVKEEDMKVIESAIASLGYHGYFTTEVLTTKETPQTPQENSKPHAEMIIVSNAKDEGITIVKVGISKPPCRECEEHLVNLNVEYEHAEVGNQKPKNFDDPSKIKTKRLATIKNSTFKWVVQNSLPRNANEVKEAAKKIVQFRMTFNGTVDSTTLLDMIDNYDRESWAKQDFCYANTGSYHSDRTGRTGVYANVGFYRASAGVSVADARINVMTASANAEATMIGVSAGFNLILASVELNAGPVHIMCGPKIGCGFAVGLDGIEAQFLGTGFTYGPRSISLKTPLLDVEINPNTVVAALLVGMSNVLQSDFKGDDASESLRFAISYCLYGGVGLGGCGVISQGNSMPPTTNVLPRPSPPLPKRYPQVNLEFSYSASN